MKKIHWSIILIILSCLAILGYLGYISMTLEKEMPSYLATGLISIISTLIGYSVGNDRGDKNE